MTSGLWEKNKRGLEREYENEEINSIKCPHCGDTGWNKKVFPGGKPFYKCQMCGFDFVISSKRKKGKIKKRAFSVVR